MSFPLYIFQSFSGGGYRLGDSSQKHSEYIYGENQDVSTILNSVSDHYLPLLCLQLKIPVLLRFSMKKDKYLNIRNVFSRN